MQPSQLDPNLEAQLREAKLTYDQVGSTSSVLPVGYHHLNRRMNIGIGTAQFGNAAQALLGWQMHLNSRLQVATSSLKVETDAVVMLRFRAGPVILNAPCRVVYVIDEPNRQGFAYGTLPGHPESGEEAFVIKRADDETINFIITAFSRPASGLAKLAGPLGRLAQGQMTYRYLRSLTDATVHHG